MGKEAPEAARSRAAAGPIDDLVDIQHRMVRRWGKFAVQAIGRMQSGDFRPGPWVAAYGAFAADTADDVLDALGALVRGAGGQER